MYPAAGYREFLSTPPWGRRFGDSLPTVVPAGGPAVSCPPAVPIAVCGERLDEDALRVYGPHGQGLVCANCCGGGYDAAISAELTEKTRTANLRVRELGFKPYLAPALSSAAVSILRLVRGQEHYGAVPLGGAYFGCVSRMTRFGPKLRREALAPALRAELEKTYAALEAFEY